MPQPQVPVNPVPVAPSPVLSTQPPSPKIFPLNLILIILIIVVIFSTVIMSAVKNQPNKQTPSPSIQPSPTSTPTLTPDSTANWKTYIIKDGKSSIKYPESWVLEDKSKEVDLYKDGNIQLSQDISISKNGHVFRSYNPMAWGPDVCRFPDSPPSEIPSDKFKDFVEIKAAEFTFRRPKTTESASTNNLIWTICKKEPNLEMFSTAAGFGKTWYETPINYDKELLSILDQILSTFKFIDSNQKSAITPKDKVIQNDKECADGICILKIESGQSCGRTTDAKCPTEYTCELDGSHPDAGGKCVRIY